MTDRLTALTELKAKVEAGEWDLSDHDLVREAFGSWAGGYSTVQLFVWAMDADDLRAISAAIALHNAVLPGWIKWDMSHSVFGYEVSLTNGPLNAQGCDKTCFARAWLLAILSALIELEKADD